MIVLRVDLDAESATRHRAELASLPGRFVVADGGPADIRVVSGRSPEWPDDVARAVRDGARGVLLTRPDLVVADRVRELSAAVAGRAVVAVDTAYANAQAWTAAHEEIAVDANRATIVDSVISVDDDPEAALIDQFAVVASLVDIGDVRLVHRTAAGYVAEAETAGPWVTLTGVPAGVASPGLSVDVVAAERRWQVRFDGAAPAIPAEITLHDRAGAHTRALAYESGRRATWRQLHDAITGVDAMGWSLDGLADALAAAGRVLRRQGVGA